MEHAPHSSLRSLDSLRTGHSYDKIGPGDTLAVSIYEAGPGLFPSSHTADPSGGGGGGGGGAPGASATTGVGAAGAGQQ